MGLKNLRSRKLDVLRSKWQYGDSEQELCVGTMGVRVGGLGFTSVWT